MHVAAEAIELGHDDRSLQPAGPCQRRSELRPALQRVGPLPRLDLDELGVDLVALDGAEPGDGLALGLDAQAQARRLATRTRFAPDESAPPPGAARGSARTVAASLVVLGGRGAAASWSRWSPPPTWPGHPGWGNWWPSLCSQRC